MKNKDKFIALIKEYEIKINEDFYFDAVKDLIKDDILSILIEAHNNPEFEAIFRSPLFSDFWEKILFSSPEIKKTMNDFNEKRPHATIALPRNFQVTSYDKIMGFVLFIHTCEAVPTEEKEAALKIIAEKYNSYYAADYLVNSAFETAALDEKINLIEWFATCTWKNGVVAYEKIANRFAEIANLNGKNYDDLRKKMRIYHVISNDILSFSNDDRSPIQNIQRAYNPGLFQAYELSHRFSTEENKFIKDETAKYAAHLAEISGVRRACFNPAL